MEELAIKARKPRLIAKGKTALTHSLSEAQVAWLTKHVTDAWSHWYGQLSMWRGRMEKWERMSEDDYSDRIREQDFDKSDAVETVFASSNHTLGVVSGMADFAFAQALDDIFGTSPWLQATPQGVSDPDLADSITKHCQWKFNQSNLESTLIDALKVSDDMGTAFVKCRWQREVETYEKAEYVAWSKTKNAPILGKGQDYITRNEDLPKDEEGKDIDGADVTWKEMLISNEKLLFNNIVAELVDFRDIAFNPKATDFDLLKTDVFHRFRVGLLDAISMFELDKDQAEALRSAAMTPRRDDSKGDPISEIPNQEPEANPPIEMVDGYVRCDPFGNGKPIRIHVIFAPAIDVLFRADYLPNDTPDGMLPIFPVRCFKKPNEIFGRGYFERYEDQNNAIDRHYNSVNYRTRMAANPITGFHRDALMDEREGEKIIIGPGDSFELKEEKTLDDFIEFKTIPDNNGRDVELMNQELQMVQMRTGITSAAQGELKGVPSANTAAGTNQIISRGAVLLKWPISQQTKDVTKVVEFCVFLNYDNQDTDETFRWGEGKDAKLIEIKAGDVQGLRADVSLSLVQSQSQTKLASSTTGIDIGSKYLLLPEPEKAAQKKLFVQALQALGFNDAEAILRDPVTDLASIGALLPPEIQPAFMAFAQSIGMAPPTAPDAPVSQPAPVVAQP